MKKLAHTSTRNLNPETQLVSENSSRTVLFRSGRSLGGIFVFGHIAPVGAYSEQGGDYRLGGASLTFVRY